MRSWITDFGWHLRVSKEALLQFNESDGYALASHVALSLMIAVFRFMIFEVSLASILDSDGVSRAIIDLVFDY
jgi:membrane protein